jgi:YihY family inner membrane protein
MTIQDRLSQKTRRIWAIFRLAIKKFLRIDGMHWAGAFAFNAFFSVFPFLVLLVTIASFFADRERAGQEVITFLEGYVPLSGEMQGHIFDTVAGVIKTREQAGLVALVILIWVGLQCFITLISATNRAWETTGYKWWQLPLKSLMLLGITVGAVLLGMAVPVLLKMARDWLFPVGVAHYWVYFLGSIVIPSLVVFLSLSLFYRLAPRLPPRFSEALVAALCATVLLQAAESLFVIYLKKFATVNAVYGVFGGIMALLLWIYLTGCIFIFGACLCAAQAESRSVQAETNVGNE